MIDEEHYVIPAHGWTCFFCGDTFKTAGAAGDHFGGNMSETAACRIKFGEEMGLLMDLRRAQEELVIHRAEDTEKDREIARLQCKHAEELRRAEESGYASGLQDCKDGKLEGFVMVASSTCAKRES
jgi:hypothetical protein